jgi:hypothetical protein
MAEDRIQISQLPSTLNLNPSDEVAVNNAGDTRKATLAQISDTIGVTEHLADQEAHRPMDDTVTTPITVWSSQKTRNEIDTALTDRQVNANQFSGVLPPTKGGTGLGALDGGKLLITQTDAMTEVAMGPTLAESGGAIDVVPDSSVQKLELSVDGNLGGVRKEINFINNGDVIVELTDDPTNNKVDAEIKFLARGPIEVHDNGIALAGTVSIINIQDGHNIHTDMVFNPGDPEADPVVQSSVDVTIHADVSVQSEGEDIGTRQRINLKNGLNTVAVVTDDPTNNRIDINVDVDLSGKANVTHTHTLSEIGDAGLLAAKDQVDAPTDFSATGTPDTTTFLRGDNVWAVPPGGTGIIDIYNNGTLIGSRGGINLIAGSNVTINQTDDPGNDQVDVTISATGGGGGGISGIGIRNNSTTIVGTRPNINFHPGSNITLSITDDAANNEVDITIAAAPGSDGQLLNVKDYGAIGDGVVNDAPAIQAAINAAVMLGLSGVFFPDGMYRITTALTPPGGSDARERPSIVNWNPVSERITFDKDPGLQNGDPIAFQGDGLPWMIIENKVFNARRISPLEYELYDTRTNARNTASTAGRIDLQARTIASIDLTTNEITFSTPHLMRTGQRVRFQSTGTLPGGTDNSTEYIFRVVSPTVGTIHPINTFTTSTDFPAYHAYYYAVSPPPGGRAPEIIDITNAGSGTIDMKRVGAQLHPGTTKYHNGLILKGSGNAIIAKDPNQTLSLLFWAHRYDNLIVEDLEFWGRIYEERWIDEYGGSFPGWGDDCFRVESCHNVQFNRCRFKYFGDAAIRFQTAFNDKNIGPMAEMLTVENCWFFMCTQTTSTVSNTAHPSAATTIRYLNNTFEKMRAGVKFTSRKTENIADLWLVGNKWKDCKVSHQFNAPVEIHSFSRIYIKNNTWENQGTTGSIEPFCILIITNNSLNASKGPVNSIIIENNIVENCPKGFRISNRDFQDGPMEIEDVIIRGNMFRNLTSTIADGSISLGLNPIRRVEISGNHFDDIANQYCIFVHMFDDSNGAQFNNYVIDKNFFGNMTHASATLINLTLNNPSGPIGTKALRGFIISNSVITIPVPVLRAISISDVLFSNIIYNAPTGKFHDPTLFNGLSHIRYNNCHITATNGIDHSSTPHLFITGCSFNCSGIAIKNSVTQNATAFVQGNQMVNGSVSF